MATGADAAADRQARHALTHLTRLARRQPQQAALLASALSGRLPVLAKPAIEVAIETGDPMGAVLAQVFRREGSAALANELHDLVPSETVSLLDLAVAVTKLAVEHQLERSPEVERAVALLHNYAQRLVAIGDMEPAYQVARQTHELMERRGSAKFDPRLAISLARVFADTGHYADAVGVLRLSLPDLRTRAKSGAGEAQADLAFALHNLAASLSELNDAHGARSTIREAITLRRRLASGGSNVASLQFAESLVVAGAIESDLGEPQKALRLAAQAVKLLEPLTDRLPDAYRPILARALQNEASTYFDLGEYQRSASLGIRAAQALQELTAGREQAFGPLYISVLRTVANAATATQDWPTALEAAERAVAVARALRPPEHATRRESLAEALGIQGAALRGLGRRDDATAAFEEVLAIRRSLAQQDPAKYRMDLVRALNNFANGVGWDAQPVRALACAREAVSLQHAPGRMRPPPDPTLAATLDTLGCRLAAVRMHRAALRCTVEACVALASPFQRLPPRYVDWMSTFVDHLEVLLWRVPSRVGEQALRRVRGALMRPTFHRGTGGTLGSTDPEAVHRMLGRVDRLAAAGRGMARRQARRTRMRGSRRGP
jgi:hypothetical protein